MTRRPVEDGLIDRRPQHLPIPLAGLRPRRERPSGGPIRIWRRRGPEIVTSAGLLFAIAAAIVTLMRPPVSAYLEGDAVHLSGHILSHPADNGGLAAGRLYTGSATLLLVTRPGGTVVASSVTYIAGRRATGVCTLAPPTPTSASERCFLHIGTEAVTCDDVLRFTAPGSWSRHCSDGQSLSVAVPEGDVAIPLPFPLGR